MKPLLIALTCLGLSACAVPSDQAAICIKLKKPVKELRSGLSSHPETHEAVGEPATDTVIITEAGCGW